MWKNPQFRTIKKNGAPYLRRLKRNPGEKYPSSWLDERKWLIGKIEEGLQINSSLINQQNQDAIKIQDLTGKNEEYKDLKQELAKTIEDRDGFKQLYEESEEEKQKINQQFTDTQQKIRWKPKSYIPFFQN